MHRRKIEGSRAQTATGSAVLIAIIGALIIAYILFLPPEERNALLDNNGGAPGSPGSSGVVEKVLLKENIGRLNFITSSEIKHNLLPFTISSQIDAQEIKRVDSLYVERNVFSSQSKNFTFLVDPSFHSNILLSFNVKVGEGRLMIDFNGKPLMDSEIPIGSLEPIRLNKDQMMDQNTMTFSVSSPGAAFWKVNKYQLEDIIISGDYLDTSESMSTQRFTVNSDELESAKTIKLSYKPLCLPSEVSQLIVAVNGDRIFTGIPDCGIENNIEISAGTLNVGDNTLSFATDLGSYRIEQISLKTLLKDSDTPVFYFQMDPKDYEYVKAGAADLRLVIIFTDDIYKKTGQVSINGRVKGFNTQQKYYIVDISNDIRLGTNSVKITPALNNLDITELRIELKESG
ncbi:hypothetical protein JW868_01325 [Candidatus Woesearchaeota archaeon]|nr:hypothetical protein [Candidatus Woesearchaeota archaeon]